MQSPTTLTAATRSRARRRGSVLLVAVMFSIIIATSLVFFLRLANNAARLSYSTYHLGVAMNLAESGLEHAVWEMRHGVWSNWTPHAGGYRRTFELGTIAGGATTRVKVFAVPGNNAYALARAIVTPTQGRPIEKWVKVKLSREGTSKVGALGKQGIVSNGNQVVMASWNSDPDDDPSTPYVAFSNAVMNDNATLAALLVDATINSGNADVNGKAAVGGSSLDAIQVGPQGYVGPFGTALGTKDPASVSTNFSADLPHVTAPVATYTSLGSVGSSLTLPRSGDTPNADGVYYYSASTINLTNKTLAVSPGNNVVINVPSGSAQALKVGGGSGSIVVGGTLRTNTLTGEVTYTPASLKIYTDGDVDISGQGSANTVTVQSYTPAIGTTTTTTTTVQTTTTIAGVTAVKGKGAQKNTVIGWDYQQTITTVTTTGSAAPITTIDGPKTYRVLIASGATEPVAATTTTTSSYVSTATIGTPEVLTDVATQAGQPVNFQIIGTRSDADVEDYGYQDFKVSGNGSLCAVVYAPNADISAKGGGNSGFVMGSLVGNTLTFTGNDAFYYDESLGDPDESDRLGIDEWDEIVEYSSPANAADYALMDF